MAFNFTQTAAEIQDILDLAQLRIAAPYDSGTSYSAGDYCTKDDGFYCANASTTGTWNSSKWDAVTVGDVLEQAAADISALNATLTQFINGFSVSLTAPTAYNSGATNINDGYIRIGKLVFVSVYFEAYNNIGAIGSQVLQDFPRPVGSRNLQAMNLDTNAMVFAYVNTSGRVSVGQVSAGNRIVVEGVYFARS